MYFAALYISLLLLVVPLEAVPFSSKIHAETALVIIDVQNDFITGSLNNSRAPDILPKIYKLLDEHSWPFIVASQDWHPIGHVSFASAHESEDSGSSVQIEFVDTPVKVETQFLYADHCVPETWGSEIESGVISRLHNLEGYTSPVNYIKKAQDHRVDSYSAFADNQYHRFTTLNDELSRHDIKKLVITGLITSACVRGTAIDGTKLGYQVTLIEDATESISQEDKDRAIEELSGVWGVDVVPLAQWEAENPVAPIRAQRHSRRF
ncbi:Isochorismatase hydrolase [Patellaria atrata CBS 101060]|uniref:nicotinamidase n=1 Tax=Patellaria atrata CBS 101060 TaxID=1346257 RepID=A0A9P4SAY3_9PEZI|nr:Isochorismatase hydrolase [Patellaria atrata CBS 101060]